MALIDKYANFHELSRFEQESIDYRIHLRPGTTNIAIVAPHGGKIERGTMAIADAIAGNKHHFYCFEGIKPDLKANKDLHITSSHFAEPRALALVAQVQRVVTIHGAYGNEAAIYGGGLDLDLRDIFFRALKKAGFYARDDPSPTRQGKGPTNICNRGRSRKGLQLEFTFGLRKLAFGKPDRFGVRQPTDHFYRLIDACRLALSNANL